jgi:hypothetical protein
MIWRYDTLVPRGEKGFVLIIQSVLSNFLMSVVDRTVPAHGEAITDPYCLSLTVYVERCVCKVYRRRRQSVTRQRASHRSAVSGAYPSRSSKSPISRMLLRSKYLHASREPSSL